MPVYSKERPELELESFFRSLYPSTRRGIRENWLRLREAPEIFKEEIEEEIGEVDLIWIRLYRELVEQRPDLEPLFNEPPDMSRYPAKGEARMCYSTNFLRILSQEDLRKDEEGNFWMDDIDKWDSLYPEEAKERRKRFWRKLGLKE
ncbi:hypothetical protein [Bilophila wadsworthia]|uniref:hypothetical protein n=1 Tax=Bilophila wadsworthia TaxID=35833 RepID=UPI00266F6A63|nr:hypothetical protein [Bilophila wadsworthia]